MKKNIVSALLIVIVNFVFAQTAPNKYWVEFKDKSNSLFLASKPLEFLSQRAIDRRAKMGISITSQDFPVNSWYLDSIANAGGVVLNTSRWHNGATFYTTDTVVVKRIRSMSFVKYADNVTLPKDVSVLPKVMATSPNFVNEPTLVPLNGSKSANLTNNIFDYGYGFQQLAMINGDYLHQMGYSGERMLIGVLDAGFYHVDTLPAFDSLWTNNQIIGYKDFVNPSGDVFQENEHGMMVLSIMGGNVADSLVGTAPRASYLLLRTEDVSSENLVEEDNWVAALEYADSVGVDVVNSSLGYTVFDDTTIVRSYSDMTGRKSRASLAATYAARKGIVICNSAGNSAQHSWRYIGVPADADSILTVGAVDGSRKWANFSSVGPAADGRVKPDVATMGLGAYVQDVDGGYVSANGTSFSSPVLAGVVACLWQAFPEKSNIEIMDVIRRSSSQYYAPDSLVGYGIPNMISAFQLLSVGESNNMNKSALRVFPNPSGGFQSIVASFYSPETSDAKLEVFNMLGELVYVQKKTSFRKGENSFRLNEMGFLTKGVYVLKISSSTYAFNAKFVKE